MTQQQFISNYPIRSLQQGSVSWQVPSNIALIKYWGKYGEQLPKNTSLSFTLKNCFTRTRVRFEKKVPGGIEFQLLFEGKKAESFEGKIADFFNRVSMYLPFLNDYTFFIETSNSFPHSSGIASSASGMGALALCLMEIEQMLSEETISEDYFLKKASFLARLGSGSACRSLEGPVIVWGEHKAIAESSNLYGTAYPYEIHPVFTSYCDTILLVDQGEKQVSSTVGHKLMHNHPFAEQRFLQANQAIEAIIPVLKEGNLQRFIEIVESEALSLHAMMMTSTPYFILMKPNTLEIIHRIWEYRKSENLPLCFTLDAGANVHLLYPEKDKKSIAKFVEEELSKFCQGSKYIEDGVSPGAFRTI